MKKFLFSACVAALLAAPALGAGPPTPEQIAKAIDDLAAEEFQVREAATDLLWQAGDSAEAALNLAAKSTDPEVSLRAGIVLNKVRLGIRPDTPTDAIAVITQYGQLGSIAERQNTLQTLHRKGQWSAVAALLRSEQNPQQRQVLSTAIASEAASVARPLIDRGEWTEAEQVLELAASVEPGLPQLTSFLLHTGGLDKHIAAARDRATSASRESEWTKLAYLLRAKDDLAAATEAADNTPNLTLRLNLRAEARRWSEAAALADELSQKNQERLDFVAQAATFYGLAWDKLNQERQLQKISQAASGALKPAPQPANAPVQPGWPADQKAVSNLLIAAKTLFLNERIDEGLDIMRQINPVFVHRIYWRQHRHSQALAFASVTPEKTLDRAWLDDLPKPAPFFQVRPDYRFMMAAQVARQLHELGRTEQVEQIWQTLQDLDVPRGLIIVPAERARRLSLLALLAWQLGRPDDAARIAADAISAGATPASVLNLLAGREGPLALAWYERALAETPPLELHLAITRAIRIVKPNPRRGGPPDNWRDLVATARSSLQSFPPPAKAERLVAFAHTCKLRGDLDLAKELFTEAAEANPATSTHLGDLAASAGDWNQAAKHYAAAHGANPADRAASFLLGHAWSMSGDSEAADKQLLLANLGVLTPEARFAMAKSFSGATLKGEALRQFELLRRTAPPYSSSANNAAQEIGNIVSDDQPLRSAESWEQILLYMLSANANFHEPEAYPTLPHLIHRVRAKAALAAGQTETVHVEFARCQELLPADVRTTVDLIPLLRRAGMDQLADDLFQRSLATYRQVLEEFPGSASYLNTTAWVCARSQRNLDEALTLVQKALTLNPGEPAYHDTLAEVHFQLGNRSAAVAAAQKCLELAPDNNLFARRLKHFREDELKTLDKIEAEQAKSKAATFKWQGFPRRSQRDHRKLARLRLNWANLRPCGAKQKPRQLARGR